MQLNVAEGFGKRIYENEFKKQLTYAIGSLEETKVTKAEIYEEYCIRYDEVGATLYKPFENWKTF